MGVTCRVSMREEDTAGSCGADLFEDQEFPCDQTSLLCDSSTPLTKLLEDITWLRPQEICQSPTLFPANLNLAYAKQGLLGDCWFLCACSFLLKSPHLLNKVLSPDQPLWGDISFKGSFTFSFWQQGHWTNVTIDDRLPCINSTLCFSRCHAPDAFWVALLEKAYAKLRGSYEQLWAGQVSEALVDMTGTVAEHWSLGDCSTNEQQTSEQDSDRGCKQSLNLRLLQPVENDCIVSCSTRSTPAGVDELGQYHALNVMEWLDVRTESGSDLQLLRIKNPWGRSCLGGSWNQGGSGWSSVHPDCASDLQARVAEGEFWLDEVEFVSQFEDVTVAYPITKDGHLKSIYTGSILTLNHQHVGHWVKGMSAGGSRNSSSYSSNPKFRLKVCNKGEVLVSLLQHQTHKTNRRMCAQTPRDDSNTKHQFYQAIALHMWEVKKKHFNLSRLLNKPPCASTHCHAYEREVILHQQLEAGDYLLIPSTYQPGAEARFLIRVFSSCPTSFTAPKASAPSLPLTTDRDWETTHFQGSWIKGRTAGGSRNFQSHHQNPQFPFTVSDEPPVTAGVNVRITLHQSRPYTNLLPIGFHVYKVPEEECEQKIAKEDDPVASCIPHCFTQDTHLDCSLPSGCYSIVPSTYEPDCSADFTITLARRIQRKVMNTQEKLGRAIHEVSNISLMRS